MPFSLPIRNNVALHFPRYAFLLLAGLIVFGLTIYSFWDVLSSICLSRVQVTAFKNRLQEWIQAKGSWGPVLFILIQASQVVIAPIPGEMTGVLGGYFFGSWRGFIFSSLGLTLGSSLAFFVGRFLGKFLLTRIIPESIVAKFDFLIERQGGPIAFLLFLIPGAPKDYLCFLLGVSKMPWLFFLVIVTFGRMPATLALSVQGAQISQERYLDFFLLFGICLIVALVLIFFREKLYKWLRGVEPLDPLLKQSSQTELKR